MKRLLALVERAAHSDVLERSFGLEVAWRVEIRKEDGSCAHFGGRVGTLLEGLSAAEQEAQRHGFWIRWDGLVGHGAALDLEAKEGPVPA